MTAAILTTLIVLLVFSGLGWWIAIQKGRSEAEGAALGLLFGPLGCLVEALLPNREAAEPRVTLRANGWQYHGVPRNVAEEIRVLIGEGRIQSHGEIEKYLRSRGTR